MTESDNTPNIRERTASLFERLESQPGDIAAVKELSGLVDLLIAENAEQKEKIRNLCEMQAKIQEALKTRFNLNL